MCKEFDLEKIIDIVYEAGAIILNANLDKSEIFDKEGDANFVTIYDMKVQQFLISHILEVIPDASFYGEEEGDGNEKKISDTGYTFIIDPIDGTTNFMFGYNNSCVSVGVTYKGDLVAGIVYHPHVDAMYYAQKGKGSFLRRKVFQDVNAGFDVGKTSSDNKARFVDKQLQMENRGLGEGLSAFGCARYNESSTELLFATVKKMFYKTLAIRSSGSAAIDLSRIASGANVVYLEMLLQPYDYAASAVIIEEAGGVISQIDGTPITLDKGCSILAGTKKGTAEVRELLYECGM